jgi:uncharacterized membrane protein
MQRITKIMQVSAPVSTVYETWRRLEDFPRFTANIESVQRLPDGRTDWVAHGPFGKRVHWQAMVTEDVPNTRLRWQSIGGDLSLRGLAEFIPAEGGSVVLTVLEYNPPLGILGKCASYLGDIEGRLESDLERLQRRIEDGAATHLPQGGAQETFLPATAPNTP